MAARILKGSFALCHWPRAMRWSADRNNTKISKSGAAAFLARSGPFWVRVGVRVRDIGVTGRVGSTPVPPSHQEVFHSSQTRTAHRPKDPGGQLDE